MNQYCMKIHMEKNTYGKLSLNKETKQKTERCSCAAIAAQNETSTGNKIIRDDTEIGIGKAV